MADPIALWVTPVSNIAGVARHILDVARVGLPGWRLVVTAPEGPLLARLRGEGCAVFPLPIDGVSVKTSVAALRHTLTRLRPAVAHSHLAKADILLAIASAGLPGKLVTTEHTISAERSMYKASFPAAVGMETVHRLRLRRFSHAIAVSEWTKRCMIARWRARTPISVILNGVDRPARLPSRKPGLRVLSLARLAPEKNLDMVLRVFARVLQERPDARLTVAGTGDQESHLRGLAALLGLDGTVEFPGFMDSAEAIADHDVLLQPSKSDNCSYTLLDAVAGGMGVATSPVGGNPEIVPERCIAGLSDEMKMARTVVEQGLNPLRRPQLPSSVPTVRGMTERIARVYDSLSAVSLDEAATRNCPCRDHLRGYSGENPQDRGGCSAKLHNRFESGADRWR